MVTDLNILFDIDYKNIFLIIILCQIIKNIFIELYLLVKYDRKII